MAEDFRSVEGLTPHPVHAIVAGGLRSIAASIPVFASLGQAWGEYENRRTTQRIEELLTDLKAELEASKQVATAPPNTLNDYQDFPELVEMIVERVRKEFDDRKRARYAHVLAGLLTDGVTRAHDEKVAMIDSLDTLTEADLRVLRLFIGKETCKVADLEWHGLGLPGGPNEQLWELACNLAKLESRGLIVKTSSHTGAIYVRQPLNKDTARWIETEYRLLPRGKSLTALLFD